MEQLISFLSLANLNIKDGDLYMKKIVLCPVLLKKYIILFHFFLIFWLIFLPDSLIFKHYVFSLFV